MSAFLGPFVLTDMGVEDMLKNLLGERIEFTFNDGNIYLGDAMQAGTDVIGFVVRVATPFNGSPLISLGTTVDPLLFGDDVDLTKGGIHGIGVYDRLTSSAQLIATLHAGGASQGSGVIYVLVR